MKTKKSGVLFKSALSLIPGGVNSPVRAFKSVGGTPLFMKRAKGAVVEDVDGNQLLDYVLSWGPMILGHAPPSVLKAITGAIKQGTSFGAPCEGEVELAKLIVQSVPSMEQFRHGGRDECH